MTRKWSGFWGKNRAELGRSMIEMLGVLAIVGVLSVGGISGFQKAMNKHKINQVTEELSQFINELLRYSKDWRRVYDQHNGAYTEVTSELDFVLPAKWTRRGIIYDSIGNQVGVVVRTFEGKRSLALRYFLTALSSENAVNLCMALYEMARPYADMLYRVDVYQEYDGGTAPNKVLYVYGNSQCKEGRKCFKDLTFAEMLENCNLYRNEHRYSSFVIFFPI